MFEVLMYLFENYIHNDAGLFIEPNELTDELLRAGFNQAEIFKALDWLEQLAELQHSDTSPYLITDSPQTIRVSKKIYPTFVVIWMIFTSVEAATLRANFSNPSGPSRAMCIAPIRAMRVSFEHIFEVARCRRICCSRVERVSV